MRNLIYTVLSIVIINGCAKRGSPRGGPVDSITPVLINASPKLNSINFDSEEIKLTFDENLALLEKYKAMHKKEIMYAYMKTLPIEDGVFTAVQKAEQYYNKTYNCHNYNSCHHYYPPMPLPPLQQLLQSPPPIPNHHHHYHHNTTNTNTITTPTN